MSFILTVSFVCFITVRRGIARISLARLHGSRGLFFGLLIDGRFELRTFYDVVMAASFGFPALFRRFRDAPGAASARLEGGKECSRLWAGVLLDVEC